jgi:hypothetical protein
MPPRMPMAEPMTSDHHHQQGVAEGEPGAHHQTGEDVAPRSSVPEEIIDVAAVGPEGESSRWALC